MNLNFFACLLIVAGIRETSFRIFQLITILRKEETLEIKKKNNKSFLKKKSTISNILKRSMLFNSIAATTPAPSPLPREDRSGIHTCGIQNATFPIGAKLKSAREKSRAIVASLFVISIARGEVRVIRASFRPSRSREIYYGVRWAKWWMFGPEGKPKRVDISLVSVSISISNRICSSTTLIGYSVSQLGSACTPMYIFA